MGVRWIVAPVLVVALSACGNPPPDHGSEVPGSALEAVGCAGAPLHKGKGNYDTGPEDVQEDARAALDDWVEQEGYGLPDVEYDEAARHGDLVLFTWSEDRTVLAAFVVRDDVDGLDDHHGWGVTSYAVCDPAEWPPEKSDEVGVQVWTNADGDRVATSLIHSIAGSEDCGGEQMTFLFLGKNGKDGQFYGEPGEGFKDYLKVPYAARADVPPEAQDTGYQRAGRELWVTAQAAYLVDVDGNAERWPAPSQQLGCG